MITRTVTSDISFSQRLVRPGCFWRQDYTGWCEPGLAASRPSFGSWALYIYILVGGPSLLTERQTEPSVTAFSAVCWVHMKVKRRCVAAGWLCEVSFLDFLCGAQSSLCVSLHHLNHQRLNNSQPLLTSTAIPHLSRTWTTGSVTECLTIQLLFYSTSQPNVMCDTTERNSYHNRNKLN